jgi:DNA-binding transcriptional MerR regulator
MQDRDELFGRWTFVFSIGEFSKITGLTVKTIRFYHEQGILLPSCVDDQSGYRYYDASKIETARAIAFLRELDFSLEEISAILRRADDDEDLLQAMRRQRAAIEEKIRRYRSVARSLDQFLNDETKARQIMAQATYEVEEKVVDSLLIAGIRQKGHYSDCGERFARIGRRYGRQICGKPLLLHFETEYRDTDADFEACMPIRNGQPQDGVAVRELPGGRCATLLHRGPYDQLGRSYAKMLSYLKDKGYDIVTPTREVYLKGPGMLFKGNPKNYLTEIQILVRPAASDHSQN